MEIMKQFEEFLPNWAHEHHLPCPSQQFSEHWNLAWNDFIKQVLMVNYDEVNAEYNNMQFQYKDVQYPSQPIFQEVEEEPIEDIQDSPKSDWEIVQEMLNNKKR